MSLLVLLFHLLLFALSPTERASVAALHRWSREDPKANAERGQRGLRDRFLREVDEHEPGLAEAERQRRADVRYRLHMKRLAIASRNARASRTPDEQPLDAA
jgi:hypothetical protein